MDDDVLVRVENVSKRFCRSLKRSLWYGLQDLGSEIGGRRHGGGKGLPQSSADVQLRPDEFWAVKDVSFELRRGECLGLIGRNGAGKTTLLRMLNGLIKPDTGRIETRGVTGALIALGAGFNPLLSGRENIYTNLSILGLTKNEAEKIIPQIIEFSEAHSFIDDPVQSYSSGMQVRLGFSIAANVKCDILLLDEVLAVGDAAFRAKCYEAVGRLKNYAATIFVGHSESSISRLCSTAVLLDKGALMHSGSPTDTLSVYNSQGSGRRSPTIVSKRYINRAFSMLINNIPLQPEQPNSIQINHGESIELELRLDSDTQINNALFDLAFYTQGGEAVAESLNETTQAIATIPKGQSRIKLSIEKILLNPDAYQASLIIVSPEFDTHYFWINDLSTITIKGRKLIARQQYASRVTIDQV